MSGSEGGREGEGKRKSEDCECADQLSPPATEVSGVLAIFRPE